MSDIVRPMSFTIDLDKRLFLMPQRGHLTRGDIGADEIRVKILRGGQPADLSGCGAGGKFYRPPDQAEITLEATIEGDTVVVPLTDHCYALDGYYVAEVYLTKGGSKTTVLAISGEIYRAGSGAVVDIEGVIPSLDALLALIDDIDEAKQAALNAAELIRSAEATATTLATGAQATATVTEVNGHWVFHFGLPRGPAGQIDNVTIDSIPGLQAELDEIRASIGSGGVDLQTVYPVGSIYMNASDATSPAQIIGGDWEKLSSRFLIASHDTNYPAGTALGNEFRTLTIRHMPPHTHGLKIQSGKVAEGTKYARLDSDDSTSTVSSSLVTSTGGEDGAAQPFSIVPPYFAVHMWRRVA